MFSLMDIHRAAGCLSVLQAPPPAIVQPPPSTIMLTAIFNYIRSSKLQQQHSEICQVCSLT